MEFNWSITDKNGYGIYEIFLKGDDTVQGRISLKIDDGVADVEITPRRMVIFEDAAQILLEKYMRK